MKNIVQYCTGESHKQTGKPCQDYAYSESGESLSVAIVSDGHGGERYFRSQHGARLAVEITLQAIRSFVEILADRNDGVFEGKPFTAFRLKDETDEQVKSKPHQLLKWLFASIISQWNEAVDQHAMEHGLDEWEQQHVRQKYLDEFRAKRQQGNGAFETTYGCTLMAYVQTPSYWFAFHIGDGKFVSLRLADGIVHCEQPIPWDNQCFLNITTSMCDSDALDEFRYCYGGSDTFPFAVFLGSDGMDDTYGDGENLHNFYIRLLKLLLTKGREKADKELKRSLPKISRIGSKDDMSVACVYDETASHEKFFMLIDYQMRKLVEALDTVESKVRGYERKIELYGNPDELDNAQRINLEYAKKDLARAKEQAKQVKRRQATLKAEVTRFKNRWNQNPRPKQENENNQP